MSIDTLLPENSPITKKEGQDDTVVNIYPSLRHLLLVLLTITLFLIVIFLIYQNGKSIYDNGI